MNEIGRVFLVCCLFASLTQVQAEGLEITQLDSIQFIDSVRPGIEINVADNFGDSFLVATPDLTQADFTIGNDTQLFVVSSGDFLSNETIGSFPPLLNNSGTNNLASLPLGESLVGFAVREPSPGEVFRTIGWAQILRTPETLEVLSSVSVPEVSQVPSLGILVPEPAASLLGVVGIIGLLAGRRRSR